MVVLGLSFVLFFCFVLRKHEICEKKQADPAHRPITRLEFESIWFSLLFSIVWVLSKSEVKRSENFEFGLWRKRWEK